MSQTETIQTPQDYVNYTFNIEARGITEVSSELMGLSNTVGNILGQLAFKTSEFLTHTESMAIGVGLAISGMFVSATRDAINFQQQVANVQAIGGESINAQAIGDAAMEYSNKFGMATASMTEGLEALARAGITSTDVMKEVLSEGVKLSKLEGMDLEDSINDLISTTNLLSENGVDMNDANYGKLVQEMNQHIVSTSESAPINAQNIIQSLQHVGGYASASGMDQDDLFAVIAQLGARGTKGEMAGTALRAFIAAGQKDTAQRALARVGLDVSDLWNDNGETMLSISEMKNVLDEALEARGYSKQEKLEFYSDFVGYKQANQIMKIDTAEVEKYKESIANAWDLGKKLDTILGTVRGNLDRIWQITQNFMTKVGGQLLTIAGIILEPVRALLEFVTALPGADTAVAVGMIFVAFKTGLLIFNKLVPAVAGFMSGISDARSETKGFRGEWQKTRDEIQKTKEIIDLIKHGDQAGLAKKHYEEHGLSARNKMNAEHIVAGQMYMGSDWYQQHGRIPWEDVDTAAQDMILERFKGTEEFKQNYNAYVNRTRANVDEIVSNPIIIEKFKSQGTLESINVWVQEIFDLLNSDRTRGQTDHAQEEGSQDNRRRNAQARTLSDIFNNRVRGNTYGNVDFKYEQNEEGYREAKEGLKQVYKDLREYTRALSNTDTNNINNIQKNAYKKLFTQVSDRGIEATKTANESEIRLVLEKGKLETHEHSYEGIKDSQVQYIASKLGLDDFKFYDSTQGDRRAEFAQQAYDILKDKDENIRKDIINELVNGADGQGGTNKLWEDSLSQIARGRRELLIHNPQIADKIVEQISNISTQGYDNNTDAVLGYFSNLDDNDEDWNIAIKSAMEVLKGDSDYSTIEENTIKYIADNIARHKETILNFQNNAESLGLSDAIQDELMDIVVDMQNDAEILQNGGAELGAAIVQGFVGDGLGRHSPGKMFWALVDEQTDISNAILQSRGIFNQNAALLGLEMTNAFDSGLGLDRVFDSGIEYLRRDSDVIKDIIANFNRKEFRTDDEQDLEYDLLPMQIDAQDGIYATSKVMQDFVQPYGFDVSNYQRFGTNFGTDIDSITQFESILWFTQSFDEFDSDKMFDSGLFDEDELYDYLELLREAFHEDKTWSYFKLKNDHNIDPSAFNSMNKFIEDYYFEFLATMSQEMTKTIINAPGLSDNVRLYRGGRLPVTSEGLGEYLGTTSTSYTKRVADTYTAMNSAVNHSANLYAPEGTLGVYMNRQQFGDRRTHIGSSIGDVFDNQIEYALGSGQPFIEIPNEATGQLSGNLLRSKGDILLLDVSQIGEVQDVVVDEVASMINSGRTDSNILNLSGLEMVNSLQQAKEKQPLEKIQNVDGQSKISEDAQQSMRGMGGYWHNVPLGMLWDTTTFFKGVKNKRVIDQDTFFDTIERVNGADLADEAREAFNNYYTDAIGNNGKINLTQLSQLLASDDLGFGVEPITGKFATANDIINAGDIYDGPIESEYWRYIPGAENINNSREFLAAVVNGDIDGVDMNTPLFRKGDNGFINDSDDRKFSNLFSIYIDDFETQAKMYEKLYGRKLPQKMWYPSQFQQFDDYSYGGQRLMVSPHEIFDLMEAYPHLIDDGLDKMLFPYLNRGEEPTRDKFKELGIYDDKFIKLPARHAFFMGADEKDLIDYDSLNIADEVDNNYKFIPTLQDAIEVWENLGPKALLDDYGYAYDESIEPTVDNSFMRMMLGLAYGSIGDKTSADGSFLTGHGIDLNPYNSSADYLLDTIIHEFTHQATNQDYRHNLPSDNPLYLPTFTHKDIGQTGYKKNYKYIADEFETNWVTSQVFKRLGLTNTSTYQDSKSQADKFYKMTADKGYDKHLQWELYDEWIETICENIEKFLQVGEAFEKQYSHISDKDAANRWSKLREQLNISNEEAPYKRQEEIAALRKQMAEDEARWAEEGVQYAAEKRKQLEELRKKQKAPYQLTREIQEQMSTGRLEYLIHYQNRGGVPNAPENTSKSTEDSSDDEAYRDRINKEMATKYTGLFPDMDNKFNQARYNVNKDGQGNKIVMSGIDWAENIHDKIRGGIMSGASRIAGHYNEEETQKYLTRIGNTKNKIQSIIEPLSNFNDGLSRAAEIFPILSPLVWGLDTALWGLSTITSILEIAETFLSVAKIQDILVSWGLVTAKEAETLAEAGAAGSTWLLTGAIGALEALLSGPFLIVIAAVIAALAILYISEKNHAEALKKNKEALDQSEKSMKAAQANYKSIRQARLAEIDATRKQMAIIKESIAVKKLEGERRKRLSAINDKVKLENDPIWGEANSLRSGIQNNSMVGFALGPVVGIASTLLAGEYEPIADKHSENIRQTTSIVDTKQQDSAPWQWMFDKMYNYDSSYANQVNTFYQKHSRDFARMDVFSPQLEKLYAVESQAQRIYGKDGARDSDMFKRAMQEVADDTGLDGEVLGRYLDYMQVEANVENARTEAQDQFGDIIADTQKKVDEILYPNHDYMGDLNDEQYQMVMAVVEEEARKAKTEMFQNALLEYMSAITTILSNPLGFDYTEVSRHIQAGNTWLGDIRNIDENKERIAKESLKVAKAESRKDYGTGAYSIYGDTPFGGAVESAHSVGMSVPNYSGSFSSNAAVTTSNTNSNLNKASSDAKSAANTAKQLIDKSKSNLEQNKEKANENDSWGLGDIAKGAVSGALDFAKKYSLLVNVISAFFPDKEHSEVQPTVNKYEIKVEQININTEDDPEKIKSALMNLIIEMQEQITPRQVSRTIGELPTQVADTATNMIEGVDDAVNNMANSANNAINNIMNGSNNNQNN